MQTQVHSHAHVDVRSALQYTHHMHKSTQLGVRDMGFASAPGPNFSLKRWMASSSACSTLQRARTSEMYSQVLRSEARAQCFVRVGDGLSTTYLKSAQETSGTGAEGSEQIKMKGARSGVKDGVVTYSDVPCPLLAHEICKWAG